MPRNMFYDLPRDLLSEIYDFLSLNQAASAASVNTDSNKVVQSQIFWKKKYQRHFPHCYKALTNKADIDWCAEFRKTYDDEYEGLQAEDRRLFSWVKEGGVESLRGKEILPSDLHNKKDKDGKSLLYWAGQIGNQQVLDYFYQLIQKAKYLTNNGEVDTSKTDEYGKTILYWALQCSQDYKHIQWLFSQGSRFDEKYGGQGHVIHVAAKRGRLDVVRTLLERKSELLEQVDDNGFTPLIYAALYNHHVAVVDYLIDKGANLNVSVRDCFGQTALHFAVSGGCGQIVASLLKAGATATATFTVEDQQFQAIHSAANEGHLDVVRALIEHDHKLLEQVDGLGFTPLDRAVGAGHVAVVDYFIRQYANLNILRGYGQKALHLAALRGDNQVVMTLLKHGVMPSLDNPIDTSKLNDQVKAKIELLEYIRKREEQLEDKRSFALCGHTLFGSKQAELVAAEALKKVVVDRTKDETTLDAHKEALSSGDLGIIYQQFQIR